MNIDELGKLIGIDLSRDESDAYLFMSIVSSMVCQHWKLYNIMSDVATQGDIITPIVFVESMKLHKSKLYFDIDMQSYATSCHDFLLSSLEASLENSPGINDIIRQGSTLLIIGENDKSFSLTIFEISQRIESDITISRWLINSSINV